MIDTGLRGRVALVTGGNHGVGAATARALSAQGASVFVAYLRLAVATGVSEAAEASVPGQAFYRARQAKTAHWVLARIVYKDAAVSGTVPLHERPAGRELLEDAKAGKNRAYRNGVQPGLIPYGFDVGEDGSFVVIEEEAVVVRDIIRNIAGALHFLRRRSV